MSPAADCQQLGEADAEGFFAIDMLAGSNDPETDLDMRPRNGEVDHDLDTRVGQKRIDGDRREAELAKNGFMPLVHKKNSDFAAFIGAQSLQKPAELDDADATANANLAARMQYMFAVNRFGHYLKCIVRDKVGSFKERADMEKWLNNWIRNYVDGDPANSVSYTHLTLPTSDLV